TFLEHAEKLNPGQFHVQFNLARIEWQLGRTQEANRRAQLLRGTEPSEAFRIYLAGFLLILHQQPDEAAQLAKELERTLENVTLSPDVETARVGAYYILASFYERLGQFEQSQKYMRLAEEKALRPSAMMEMDLGASATALAAEMLRHAA